MRHLYMALVFVGLLCNTAAFAADPVGRYQVEGGNPGDSGAYRGVVTVQKTGQTYRVIWTIGSSRFVGTGIETRGVRKAVGIRCGAISGNMKV